MKIKKGDNVIMLSGKDKGKKGKVLKSFPSDNKVIIEGLNISRRHQRPRQQGKKGEILEVPMPVNVSKVALIDPKDSRPTRVSYKLDGGKKIRISKRSGQNI